MDEDEQVNHAGFRPERVRRPREQVELQLRKAILAGNFRPGDRLPSEAELSRDFAVSRSTIREALRALAAAGLITTSPGANGGSFVEGVDHHSLGEKFGESVENIVQLGSLTYSEVAEVRRMLEVPSARAAASNRQDEHLRQLDEIVEREKHVDVSDPSVPELNASFHQVIASASGNRLLAALVAALHRVTHPLTYTDMSVDLGRQSVIHHLRIVEAIRERDAEAAGEVMTAHLALLQQHVADGLDRERRANGS
jgi:DNA-binding FadR family transcriptional regulator